MGSVSYKGKDSALVCRRYVPPVEAAEELTPRWFRGGKTGAVDGASSEKLTLLIFMRSCIFILLDDGLSKAPVELKNLVSFFVEISQIGPWSFSFFVFVKFAKFLILSAFFSYRVLNEVHAVLICSNFGQKCQKMS